MGFQNITAGNGIAISLTGMVIVFCGLLLISTFIGLLPKILKLSFETERGKKVNPRPQVSNKNPEDEADDQEEHDLVSIIGLILYMEQERLAGNPGMIRNSDIWGTAGKSTIMPRRRMNV